MSRKLVDIMHGQFNRSHNFLMQFIERCPDSLWEKKYAGFIIWQHVYHCFLGNAFFATPENSDSPIGLFGNSEEQEIFHFKKEPQAPQKETLIKYAEKVHSLASSCIRDITDEDLSNKNEAMSNLIGKELTQLDVLAMLIAHNMYHFGACDGALRDNGLPGID